eukprot:scaffold34836_cov129-Isochrysis_galbana.AAC.6
MPRSRRRKNGPMRIGLAQCKRTGFTIYHSGCALRPPLAIAEAALDEIILPSLWLPVSWPP